MENLKEIVYQNDLNKIARGANFLESELAELMTYTVKINENDENTLNAILADAERRIEAARRGLSIANKLKDPAERKQHVSKMMGHLNRTRSLLDKVVKEFFPQKPGEAEEPTAGVENSRDEFITPQQAAETLGIHPSKLQSLVMGNKLRMYNNGGKWTLKGSEVQKLANEQGATGKQQQKQAPPQNRADFSRFVGM